LAAPAMRSGPRRAASSRDRRVEFREPRERILIVCEGEKTEPAYFRGLIAHHKLHTVRLDDGRRLEVQVEGAGRSTLPLVEYALAQQRTASPPYAEVWCVFDRDSFPPDDFDNAVSRAAAHPVLRAAWSNEAFELWYLLHFEYLDASPPGARGAARDHYVSRLHALLRPLGRERYGKNDPGLYVLLGDDRRQRAAANAHRLLASYPEVTAPHACCPATTVHDLVTRLLQFAPEYQ
jgi:hypothetical protein